MSIARTLMDNVHLHYGENWIPYSEIEECRKVISGFFRKDIPIIASVNIINPYFNEIKKELDNYKGEKRIKYHNAPKKTFIVENYGEAPAVLAAFNEKRYDGAFLFKLHTEILGRQLIEAFDLEEKILKLISNHT